MKTKSDCTSLTVPSPGGWRPRCHVRAEAQEPSSQYSLNTGQANQLEQSSTSPNARGEDETGSPSDFFLHYSHQCHWYLFCSFLGGGGGGGVGSWDSTHYHELKILKSLLLGRSVRIALCKPARRVLLSCFEYPFACVLLDSLLCKCGQFIGGGVTK